MLFNLRPATWNKLYRFRYKFVFVGALFIGYFLFVCFFNAEIHKSIGLGGYVAANVLAVLLLPAGVLSLRFGLLLVADPRLNPAAAGASFRYNQHGVWSTDYSGMTVTVYDHRPTAYISADNTAADEAPPPYEQIDSRQQPPPPLAAADKDERQATLIDV